MHVKYYTCTMNDKSDLKVNVSTMLRLQSSINRRDNLLENTTGGVSIQPVIVIHLSALEFLPTMLCEVFQQRSGSLLEFVIL